MDEIVIHRLIEMVLPYLIEDPEILDQDELDLVDDNQEDLWVCKLC